MSVAKHEHFHPQFRHLGIPASSSMSSSSPATFTSSQSRSHRRPTAATRSARRVGFNRKTKIYLHLHLDDMTKEEYNATHTTEGDSQISQQELVQALQIIRRREQQGLPQNDNNAAVDDNDDDACIRGIEHMRSAAAVQERKATKEAVLTAVLDEQDWQWEKDADDAEALRAASLQHSARSQGEAAERARQDAQAVRAMVAPFQRLAVTT